MRLQFGELNITPRVEERLQELDYTVQDLEHEINAHKSDGEPSLYVGTYGKYNDGSIRGLWLDLSTFCSYDEFITFCKAIHADEEDPEMMAQDFECFPRQWYNEDFISEEDFNNILEMKFAEYRLNKRKMKQYSQMGDKHGQEAVDDYMEFEDSLDNFEEEYCGEWDSEEDFARHIVDECYNLEKMMGNLANYFEL